jgi:hypothetical protein
LINPEFDTDCEEPKLRIAVPAVPSIIAELRICKSPALFSTISEQFMLTMALSPLVKGEGGHPAADAFP